ncbi:MAG TPA: hypothetical protein VHV79_09725 [Mycobacteriales bacterium]|jgi:hypothetical protein|nr:hypothetical protein [Mycobacteriales bacterium]
MTRNSDEAVEVLRSVWNVHGTIRESHDEDPPAQKVCRNMKDVSFDGMAEPGSDLRQAWRDRLAREGKLSSSGGSIRDLVLGNDTSR